MKTISQSTGMDNLQAPQSAEHKKFLEEECGLVPYRPTKEPDRCNPNHPQYHMVSALIFGLSAYGRWQCTKMGLPRIQYTISMLCIPIFYFLSIHHKEKRFKYDSSERKTFEENLEFYPITRRAWNRAIAIYDTEKGTPPLEN